MEVLWVACGLVLVIEGLAYAAFPEQMRRMMRQALELPEGTLRMAGLLAAIVGVAVVWLARG
ncbi:DUF2065 domain-containing protein [Stella sp.]|uniref:DUF2065 domain-containing protein n=1 Tax=Stella sp. TaxID=2912054 RepID=UPI0035AED512